jgi:hypothetical protein
MVEYDNLNIDQIKNKRQIIYKDDVIKISHIDNDSDSVVIVFAYGLKPPAVPKENFYLYTRNDKNIIHVVDLMVSWFNNFTADFILEKIKHLIENKKVYLVGMSMGAFNAVQFSNHINFERCLAFCPQFFVKKMDMDMYDGYLRVVLERLKTFNVHTSRYAKNKEYFIVFGSDDQEKAHSYDTIKYCYDNNINAFFTVFNDSPHLVLDYLNKDDGPVHKIVENFLHYNVNDLKNKYSKYSAHFFHASDNFII